MDEPTQRPSEEPSPSGNEDSPAHADPPEKRDSSPIVIRIPERRRTEDSVMEMLPEGKTERLSLMRHELAELQRQLIEAQQRIATELLGRAEDAERFEALEVRLRAQEVKAQEDATRAAELTAEISGLRSRLENAASTVEELRRDLVARDARIEESLERHRELTEQLETHVASLREAKALVAARDAELVTRTSERDAVQATQTRLEGELAAALQKHRDLSEQLESLSSSLRDAKTLAATREADLATTTSERDAAQAAQTRLEGELEQTRASLDAARAKAQEIGSLIAGVAQELLGTPGVADLASASEPRPFRSETSSKPAEPAMPPPIPREPRAFEATLAAEPEAPLPPPPSRSRGWLMMVGGAAMGAVLAVGAVKLGGPDSTAASSTAATKLQEIDPAPPALDSPPSAPAGHVEFTVDPTEQARADVRPDAGPSARPENASAASRANAGKNGIIVLPPEADGHRVFVDGRVVEAKDSQVVVPCGPHEVKIGSKGEPRLIEVACDGETPLR
jgi:hypothetical protein